tara:strand:+ start:13982 stop:14791 length:810 start_codon:yes stop_codon:yes gene_type:complete
MVYCHCYNIPYPTEFSSWSASLHLVVVYANSMPIADDPHVAVIDTQQLERDGNVKVWQTSHLFRFQALSPHLTNAEFLAHGRIAGSGYKAVGFAALRQRGLYSMVLGLEHFVPEPCDFQFGFRLREQTFGTAEKAIEDCDILTARHIATLFGELRVPVAVALLCLRPRPNIDVNPSMRADLIARLVNGLSITSLPDGFASEPWLCRGAVDTRCGFQDVEQWIELFRALSMYNFSTVAEHKRGKRLRNEEFTLGAPLHLSKRRKPMEDYE